MLAARAEILLSPVVARYPFIETVSSFASGPAWLGWFFVTLSVLLGAALSWLDASRRVDILSLPLLGLIAWNLAVYVLVIRSWVQPARRRGRGRILPVFMARRILGRIQRLVARSAEYNAALAPALNRFVQEWSDAAKPLLLDRAARIFHLCAAGAGLGLIAGLYLRGVTLDYTAGWESTFLDADVLRVLLSIIYGPASAVTHIPLPDAQHLEAIRWRNGLGGERAAYWIHLLAASVVLFVVLPRLALAAIATASLWRRSFRAALPPTLAEYFRRTFGEESAGIARSVMVIPYAYEPADSALVALRSLISAALGGAGAIDVRPPVRYGDEETLRSAAAEDRNSDVVVIVLNLASTPEDENHGAAIAGVRQRLATARAPGKLLVVVDEGPYAARMAAAGGAAERIVERRRAWQAFVEKIGLQPCFANLAVSPSAPAANPPHTEVECLRSALLAA
jgi:hypothetical protein